MIRIARRRLLAGATAVAGAAVISRRGEASDWRPNTNVRIIVPAGPGGPTDVIGRLFGNHLQQTWGLPVVVENKSGGGGTIGTLDFLRQKPDGHTILIGNPGPTAIAYSVFKNLTYRPDQLIPVSNLIRLPNMIVAHPTTGIKTVPELIAYIKANPDKLTYGTSGTGQSPHLTAAWFFQLTGLKMAHLPFRGAGPALAGALTGEPPILFDSLFPGLSQLQAGKLNGLAVTSRERSPALPDMPTVAETVPDVLGRFDVSTWFCAFYAAGTPDAAIDSLNRQCKIFLESDEVQKRIATYGARPDYQTVPQFKSFVAAEIEKFGGIIRREGLQMEVN